MAVYAAETAFTGLAGTGAIAISPQGGLYVALPKGVAQVLAPRVSETFTGIAARSMAFDRAGNLFAAGEREIVRISPWGEVSAAGSGCGGRLGTPLSVAAGQDGAVYYTGSGSPAICAGGRALPHTIERPAVLAWSSFYDALVVVDGSGSVWRLRGGKAEKWFAAGRPVSGIAIDEEGSAYVLPASEARVAIYGTRGNPLGDLKVPEPGSGITFGGVNLDRLFVSGPRQGAVYRLAPNRRAEPAVWENNRPFRITAPADGAILNRHDGSESAGGLRIEVSGRCRDGDAVAINGSPAVVKGTEFRGGIMLTARETRIEARNRRGETDAIAVLRDRNSFRRYRMSVDDNILWLKEIALHSPPYASIFDNAFLAFWRDMHRKYGARVHFNIYYETAGFNLSAMPHRYREEWRRNADWIRLTFHARANNPDRPYLHTTAERIARDYAEVNREIERFAGREVMSPVTTVHWGEATQAGVRALKNAGVTTMAGYFEVRQDIPSVSYHLTTPQLRHLLGRDSWRDPVTGILFVRHDMVINSFALDQILPRLEKLDADPHQSELLELMIHEQYFYPDYSAYRPDYRDAVERAIRWATGKGYRPVFLEEGFLGNGR